MISKDLKNITTLKWRMGQSFKAATQHLLLCSIKKMKRGNASTAMKQHCRLGVIKSVRERSCKCAKTTWRLQIKALLVSIKKKVLPNLIHFNWHPLLKMSVFTLSLFMILMVFFYLQIQRIFNRMFVWINEGL
jgi:hypothetical protein